MALESKQRNSSIELLRLLCMMAIIGHHIITNVLSINFQYPIYTFVDTILHVAVVVFVLISGYFGIHFKLKKLLSLEAQLIYYSVLAALIAFFVLHSIGLKDLIKSFFPVSLHIYWFMSAYMELYLASPFLNKVIDGASNRQYVYLLAVLGISYIFLFDGDLYNAGTNLTGFSFLYILGRYLRNSSFLERPIKYTLYFLVCYFIVVFAISSFLASNSLFAHFINQFYKYNGIGIILFAIAILHVFVNWRFYNAWINRFASSALSIYLIHENHKINEFTYVKPTEFLIGATDIPRGGILLIMIFAITCICILIDQVRIIIFDKIKFDKMASLILKYLG